MAKFLAVLFSLFLFISVACGCAAEVSSTQQSPINRSAANASKYPKIVLYSVSWCPHCNQTKEYLTRNDIPFINRDVELDKEAMDLLTNKYKCDMVPVIVIGNDDIILKGFEQDKFEKAIEEYKRKHKN
jgi:glutaredoxin 3